MRALAPVSGRFRRAFQPEGRAMLSAQLSVAIAAARNFPALDEISRTLWQAHAEACLSDAAAQAVAEAVEARKQVLKGPRAPAAQKRAYVAPRPCRSPDKARSIRRRRAAAASGAVPSRLACHFTLGETAALSVIAREVQRHGICQLCLDAIAAQAGTSRSVVQRALKQARALGLVRVEERPQPGRKNLTNVVTVTSPDWRAWLKIGSDRVSEKKRHGIQLFTSCKKTQEPQKTHLRDAALGGIFRKGSHGIQKCNTKPKLSVF
jgi:hypothetical protein